MSSIRLTVSLLAIFCIVPAHCMRCPSGTFQANNNSCQICPPGTWREARDSPSDAPCIPCRPGFFSPFPGAVGKDLCRPCRTDTFADALGSTSCKKCPRGTMSNFRATKCLRCGPGTAIARDSKSCIPCAKGFYSSQPNNRKCLPCPLYKTSSSGATAESQCRLCPPGQSAFRGPCEKCSMGEAKSGRAGNCDSCLPGTFSDKEGATKCKPCPPGTFQKNNFLGTKCKPCRSGSKTVGSGNAVCRVIGQPCKKSFFEDKKGDCRACDEGYRLNLGEKKCEKCPPGSVSPGGVQTVCVQCTNGQVPGRSNRYCGCPQGKFPDRKGGCKPCPPGRFNPNEEGDSRIFCDVGTFSSKPGAIRCKTCPPGHIAPFNEATRCIACPEGTIPGFGGEEGNKCVSKTTRCPPGFKRRFVGARFAFFGCRRVACTLDTDEKDVGKTCAPCDPGTFLDDEKKRCRKCRFDEFSLGGLITRCKKCPNGRVQDVYDPSKCSCRGFRAEGKGLQDGFCLPCPAGSVSDHEDDLCVPCPPGAFANKSGMSICKACPIDTFSNKEGAKRCRKCPKGRISDRRPGGINCIPSPV